MAVITLSRQYGSGGTEVAARVCEILGYKYLDKEIIAAAANEAGLSGGEVVAFDEQHSKARSFLDRLLYPGPHVVAQVAVRPPSKAGTASLAVEELDRAECLNLVRSAIHAAYREGNAVIVGRGGQAVLQNIPGVLHVRIEAPIPGRVLRVQHQQELDLEAAYQLIVKRDRKTAAYLNEVFDVDWNDPLLYHLVLNTGKWDVEQAAQIVVHAAQALEV